MDYVVLDTDVASQSIKDQLPGPLVVKLAGPAWCITFVTLGELWQWAEIRHWGSRNRDRLERWLNKPYLVAGQRRIMR
jgi:predicted nucleic acid-binding protein